MLSVFSAWSPRPAAPALLPGEIHVWHVTIDLPPARLGPLYTLLQSDEQQRAARFRFALHRDRFIARRGLLRLLLASYLALPASALRFAHGPQGKPYLTGDHGTPELSFSLSHADSIALVAVTHAGAVGVDVEVTRSEVDILSLASRFFAPAEIAAIRALPVVRQTAACYACWTRKEAYTKALGTGLSLPLDSFAVTVEPEQAALLWDERDATAPRQWRLYAPLSGPEIYAAVAVGRPNTALTCYRWQPDQI